MTLTELFIVGRYRPGVIMKAVRHGKTEWGVEEHRHGVTANGAWGGSGDPRAIDDTLMAN